MTGKDLLVGLGNISHKYYEEAENDTVSVHNTPNSLRKILMIAAVIALLVITITACAYAIQRIRMNLVQHNVPVQTKIVVPTINQQSEMQQVNILTDCYPQSIPSGYEILCGSPLGYDSRNLQYCNEDGKSIYFRIATSSTDERVVLRSPVEESLVLIGGEEFVLRTNEDAQLLEWHNQEDYYVSLFTDDVAVDLLTMANSVDYGKPIPVSVWYHRGQEWNPWYPQNLPVGYICTDVSPVSDGYQSFTFRNGSSSVRYGISTKEDLAPTHIGDEEYWEDTKVSGKPARILRNQTTQRTLFWENKEEGFYAFLETMDEMVDITALAEGVTPGEKIEVSKSYLGPDYTIELEQESTTYIEWQSIYPQHIPEGYVLDTVSDRAYGQQSITWKNIDGNSIAYTFYFRLGQYGREFEGAGQPEIVSINGHTGYRSENNLIWADEQLGFAYELRVSGDVDLIALAESVGPGPELEYTNDKTDKALAQLGDYQITALPENMIEDGLSGFPLEDGGDWYSYVRRWYYDRTNNDQIYFTYETYVTDCASVEDMLRLYVSSYTKEPEQRSINGNPGLTLQDGDKASIVWVIGDASSGVCFQMYSEQFTVEELLEVAESVQKQ